MSTYTVIGLWIDDELVIAGVVEGDVPVVDNGPDAGDGYQRYAQPVEADSPDDAERVALELASGDDDD